ncbi:MAG: 6-bladed beta-propeller [Niabella sp.]|nr:6-bladed beta-propeller [Niabella sp.]
MKKRMLLSLLIGIGHMALAQRPPVLLDPATAKDTTLSCIFEETEIIPLETTRQSTFGIISQLVVTNQYFIILDTDTDAVLFFNRQGKFIIKYKNKPNRYRINFIQPDNDHHALLIFSQNRNYTLTAARLQGFLAKGPGALLSTRVMATRLYLNSLDSLYTETLPPSTYLLTNPVALGTGRFAFSFIRSDGKNTGTQDYALKMMNNGNITQQFFPYHTKTDSVFYGPAAYQCSFFPTLNDSVFFISRPAQPCIYRLTPGSLTEAYQITGPKTEHASATPEAFSFTAADRITISGITITSARSGRKDNLFLSNTNTVNNFIDQKRFLFFNVRQAMGYYNYYVFDKKEQMLYNRNKLKADSSCYPFPLQGPVLAFDEKNIYQGLSPRALFNLKKSAGSTRLHYEKSLSRFYDTGKPENNPVILRLKTKED